MPMHLAPFTLICSVVLGMISYLPLSSSRTFAPTICGPYRMLGSLRLKFAISISFPRRGQSAPSFLLAHAHQRHEGAQLLGGHRRNRLDRGQPVEYRRQSREHLGHDGQRDRRERVVVEPHLEQG